MRAVRIARNPSSCDQCSGSCASIRRPIAAHESSSDRPPSPYLHLFVRAYQSRSQRRPLGTSRKTGLAKRVPRNTTGCLQAYDHLFTLTSQSEERTKQARWVWAQPNGRAHTHQLRNAPPSASQRPISSQDVGYLVTRGRVGTLVQDGDAGGDDAAVDGGQDLVPRGLAQTLLFRLCRAHRLSTHHSPTSTGIWRADRKSVV